MTFLTFDLGTTLYKVALFDDAGRMLALQQIAPPVTHPQPGHWELDTDSFKRVLIEAVNKLRLITPDDFKSIAACSFATQANSFTLLDENSRPLLPLILWPDQRAAEFGIELAALNDVAVTSGMKRLSIQLAVAKFLWLIRHEPKIVDRARKICFISDYLTQWLTSQLRTEASVAGLSAMGNIRSLQWSGLPDGLKLSRSLLPPIARAGIELGPIDAQAADELGLPRGCRFIVGCLDQFAGAIGTGTIQPRRLCETTGTVLAAVRCSDRLDFSADVPVDLVQAPSFDEKLYFQMTFSSTSANLLEWYRNSLADKPSFEELSRLAAVADDSVSIEPYRDGEPIEQCFRHVRAEHSTGQVVRGIMRGVAEALKRQISSLSPQVPVSIRSAGGAARSDVWLQIKADVLGTTMEAVECAEPTSLGAAMLAASAMGLGSLPELAERWIKVRATFHPGGSKGSA